MVSNADNSDHISSLLNITGSTEVFNPWAHLPVEEIGPLQKITFDRAKVY